MNSRICVVVVVFILEEVDDYMDEYISDMPGPVVSQIHEHAFLEQAAAYLIPLFRRKQCKRVVEQP